MLLSVFLWQSPPKPLYKTAYRFSSFIQSNANAFGWYVTASETQPWTLSPRLCRSFPHLKPTGDAWIFTSAPLLTLHFPTARFSTHLFIHASYIHPCRHSLGPALPTRPPWVAHSTFPSLNSSSVPLRTSSFVARSVCINSLCLHTPSL